MIDDLKCPYCGNETVELNDKENKKVTDKYKCSTCEKTFGSKSNEAIQQCHTFYFSTGGFHEGHKTMLVEEHDGYAVLDLTPLFNMDLDSNYKMRITLDEWHEIKAYLFNELFILSWDEDYHDPGILDGTQWELKLKFDGRKKFEAAGSNRFPVLFDELVEYLNPYFDQVET